MAFYVAHPITRYYCSKDHKEITKISDLVMEAFPYVILMTLST